MRIVESTDSVDIYYDIGQGTGFNRVIPITNRPHLPKEIHQYWGDSIARWDGDTLVVDVTNFSEETEFRGSRENLHLIERYKRIDPTTLQITTTAEDPTTWVKPFTFVQELRKNADKPNMVYEGGCHEGNYGLLGMMVNTRAAEKAFAGGQGARSGDGRQRHRWRRRPVRFFLLAFPWSIDRKQAGVGSLRESLCLCALCVKPRYRCTFQTYTEITEALRTQRLLRQSSPFVEFVACRYLAGDVDYDRVTLPVLHQLVLPQMARGTFPPPSPYTCIPSTARWLRAGDTEPYSSSRGA